MHQGTILTIKATACLGQDPNTVPLQMNQTAKPLVEEPVPAQ